MKRAKMKVVPFAREDVISTSGPDVPIFMSHFYTDKDFGDAYYNVGRGYCYEDGSWYIYSSDAMSVGPMSIQDMLYTFRPSGLEDAPMNTWYVGNAEHCENVTTWTVCDCAAHSSLPRIHYSEISGGVDWCRDHQPMN